MNRVKNNEIGLITAISCVFVIFIHISSQAIVQLRKESIQMIMIYTVWKLAHFVVQTFIMLSSLKICLKYRYREFNFKTYINFIKNRIINIFIPYMIWVMIYYIYFCSIGYFPFRIKDYIGYVFMGNLASPFYFIVIIAQFYILMPVWIYIISKFKAIHSISISLIITVLSIYIAKPVIDMIFGIDFIYSDRIFTSYIIYWMIGCYIAKFYDESKMWFKSKKIIITFGFIFFAILSTAMSYIQFLEIKYFKSLEFIHMVYCISTVMFLYMICIYMLNIKNFIIPAMYNLNRCSFYIYLSHCLVLNIVSRHFQLKQINDVGYIFIFKFLFCYSIPWILSNLYLCLKSKLKSKIST